ncbi:MAG: hypothetical protein AB7I30_03770 [Isosphaeraceae bacterium]
MSWQVTPLKVDWPKFLRSFPKPGKWTKAPKAKLSREDSRQQEAWIACYVAMRKHLPEETIFSVDGLVRATSLNSPPKWKGFQPPVWYKPHRDFDPEDFEGPGSGCPPIPLMSPGNVVDMLHCLRLRDPGRIAEDLRIAWDRLAGKEARKECERLGFDDAEIFLAHLHEWRAIMTEVESENAGYAIDFD